ncbi:hypothetical protein CK220_27905 [Mesorhizobium sp. WSM3860]|nr:hypothetical protein CK220_27905 [Mesorhizobium sp. WSM3860]
MQHQRRHAHLSPQVADIIIENVLRRRPGIARQTVRSITVHLGGELCLTGTATVFTVPLGGGEADK